VFLRTVILIIFYGSYLLFAQNTEVTYNKIAKKIVQTALGEQKGYALLRDLCRIGPRLSGYPGSFEAIEWTQELLDSLGCDRVWLQSVMVPHWERGEIEQAEIIETTDTVYAELIIAALGGSIGTPPDGITAEVLEVHSFEELNKKADQATGKIIFFNRPFDPTVLHSFAGYGGAVKQRTEGAIHAAQVGAVAAIVRSVTSKNDNTPHTGVMSYADSLKKIPAAAGNPSQNTEIGYSKRFTGSNALNINKISKKIPSITIMGSALKINSLLLNHVCFAITL